MSVNNAHSKQTGRSRTAARRSTQNETSPRHDLGDPLDVEVDGRADSPAPDVLSLLQQQQAIQQQQTGSRSSHGAIDGQRRYSLIIRQQPEQARCSGFGGEELNRRPINPCIVVQVAAIKDDGLDTSLSGLGNVSGMIVHATLLSEDGKTDQNVVTIPASVMDNSWDERPDDDELNDIGVRCDPQAATPSTASVSRTGSGDTNKSLERPTSGDQSKNRRATADGGLGDLDDGTPEGGDVGGSNGGIVRKVSLRPPQTEFGPPSESGKWERSLFGSIVSSCHFLTDLSGSKGAYFVFPDLSIRVEGKFRLKLILSDLGSVYNDQTHQSATQVASTISSTFISYTAKDWPGMKESTDISKHFADQGIKIPIRRKTRRRYGPGGEGDDGKL